MDSHEKDTAGSVLTTTLTGRTESTQPLGHRQHEDDTKHHRSTQGLSTFQRCVVLAGACFHLLVAMGIPFSIGSLYVVIISTYSVTRREAALVQGLCIGILFGTGPLSGLFMDRFGQRNSLILGGCLGFLGLSVSWFAAGLIYLVLTIGVVAGLGSSLIFLTSSVVVASTFGKARRLALPVMMFAGGVGSVLLPKVLEYLQSEYGLRGTLLIASGLYLNIIPIGVLVTSQLGIIQKSTHVNNTFSKTTLVKRVKILKNPRLILFMITAASAFGTANGTMVALLDFIKSRGYTSDAGIQLLLICNASATVTRLISGFLALIPRTSSAMISCFFAFVVSVSVLILRSALVYSSILACVVMLGVGYGGVSGLCSLTTHEFVGDNVFPFAFGVLGLFVGISNPTAASIIGLMYDSSGSYELPFLVCGILGNVGAALTLVPVIYGKLRE